MDELSTIELFVSEEDADDGIQAISLVEFPAIEENFVALSKQKMELKTINEEKRLVIGLALVPDKKIFRKAGEYEYNIVFSKDTVRKAAEKYMRSLKIHNTTVEHETNVNGVFLTETWIVDDPKNDKSNIYGLNAREGSWVVCMRVENDGVWKGIKEGRMLGFSIEGIFSDDVDEVSKDDMSLFNKIVQVINDYEGNKV